MITQLTGSIRTNSSKSNKLKFCINFRPQHVQQFDMQNRKFVEIRNSGTASRYKMSFHDKDGAGRRPVQYNKTSGGAAVYVDPESFKLKVTGKKSATPLTAEIKDDNIIFEFDGEEFLKSAAAIETQKQVNRIETTEDKIAAGFDATTAWGVAYRETANAEMRKIVAETLALKLKGFYGHQ